MTNDGASRLPRRRATDAAAEVGGGTAAAGGQPSAAAPDGECLMVDAAGAARLLGLTRSTFHRLRSSGTIPPGVVLSRDGAGRSRVVRWRVASLRDAMAQLEAGQAGPGRRGGRAARP